MSHQFEPAIYRPEFANTIVPPNGTFPFYHIQEPSVLPGISDKTLSILSPFVVYWIYSLFFHALDTWGANSAWLERYRIHESAEVKSRNLVSKWQVVLAVLFQQVLQTILGVLFVEGEDSSSVDHTAKMTRISPILVQSTLLWLGNPQLAQARLEYWGSTALHFVYWWAIPTVQILVAFFIIDTWQYFWHRFLHVNKFLYRHLHSWHHRLYVPYAFGALYNHPIEGIILDIMGAMVAEHLTRLTLRQATLLFTFSTLKTVDDHCGYSLPFDPFQIFFPNNADYHDIHHQAIGIKKNFSQPFFIHWDTILGTKMTRQEVIARSKKPHINGVLKQNGSVKANGVHVPNGNGVHVANGDHKPKTE
ncbi:hypothetical protein CPB86DRAFT_170461 [Serendipita vermifera]|nr:hypothetical protein CPB86DRAFT_170461 [Serendipita vermifera]